MKLRKIITVGLPLSLAAVAICGVAAFMPEKAGIRIPVHAADGKMGYIDDAGRMVVAAKWDRASPFGNSGEGYVASDGVISGFDFRMDGWIPKIQRYRTRGEFFIVDRAGNIRALDNVISIHPMPDLPEPDSYGMILTHDSTGFRWILANGAEAFPGSWENAIDFNEDDPAAVSKEGKWGFINRKGEIIAPFEWKDTGGFDGSGRACVSASNKWGAIDPTGKLVIPLYFSYLAGFDDEGMCRAIMESGSGFIDRNGKIVIPFRHALTDSFDRFGMARVLMRNDSNELHTGWMDRFGRLVIPCVYGEKVPTWAKNFSDHELLPVSDSRGTGLIDRKGKSIIPTGHGALTHIEDPMAPGKFWITRVPDQYSGRKEPMFVPACYDQNGKLIWAGNTWTRKRVATICLMTFSAIAATLFIVRRRLPAVAGGNI